MGAALYRVESRAPDAGRGLQEIAGGAASIVSARTFNAECSVPAGGGSGWTAASPRLPAVSHTPDSHAARLAPGRSGFGQRLRWPHSPLQAAAAGSCSANTRADGL
jgi:hypothetical protein